MSPTRPINRILRGGVIAAALGFVSLANAQSVLRSASYDMSRELCKDSGAALAVQKAHFADGGIYDQIVVKR